MGWACTSTSPSWLGVSIVMGVPPFCWMVYLFISWWKIDKWMMTRGTPISGNQHLGFLVGYSYPDAQWLEYLPTPPKMSQFCRWIFQHHASHLGYGPEQLVFLWDYIDINLNHRSYNPIKKKQKNIFPGLPMVPKRFVSPYEVGQCITCSSAWRWWPWRSPVNPCGYMFVYILWILYIYIYIHTEIWMFYGYVFR